ncbi:MAG: hypothetical protein MHM6MM_008597 [Cercozoa sp. M6MM]
MSDDEPQFETLEEAMAEAAKLAHNIPFKKPPRRLSGYMLFVHTKRPELAAQGLKVTEVATKGGELWRALGDQQDEWNQLAAKIKALVQPFAAETKTPKKEKSAGTKRTKSKSTGEKRERSSNGSRLTKLQQDRMDKFGNHWQKKPTPADTDGLYQFYTTLRKEKPDSKLAKTWLMEHGLLPADEAAAWFDELALLKKAKRSAATSASAAATRPRKRTKKSPAKKAATTSRKKKTPVALSDDSSDDDEEFDLNATSVSSASVAPRSKRASAVKASRAMKDDDSDNDDNDDASDDEESSASSSDDEVFLRKPSQ